VATGKPDARSWYHAAVIADAQGRTDDAATLVDRALALHPEFDPVKADAARALLERLGR
jgi:hypothetical protein